MSDSSLTDSGSEPDFNGFLPSAPNDGVEGLDDGDLDILELALAQEMSHHKRLSAEVDEEPAEPSSVTKKLLNGTAYRIFKLLQWLIDSPLTLDELNSRFMGDPLIGKAVSNDSVWLYTNTLKALGCKVRRPSPRNGFCYELLSHPFGLSLSDTRQEALVLAKAYAQKSFSHQEMMVLEGVFKKIIRHSNVPSPQACIDRLFQDSRSYDLEACSEHIRLLEAGASKGTLYQLKYRSPLQGEEEFLFLPEFLYYEQGVPYVRGDRPDLKTPSSLRVDRIFKVRPADQPSLLQDLLGRREQLNSVRIRVFVHDAALWPGFGLDVRHGVYSETVVHTQVTGHSFVELEFQARDFFYLKQRLLASGYHFQVHSPSTFRAELQTTLDKMLAYYVPGNSQSLDLATLTPSPLSPQLPRGMC